MNHEDFRTSVGSIVPADAMDRIVNRLRAGDDEHTVVMYELPPYIPEYLEMCVEINEVMDAVYEKAGLVRVP